MRGARHLWLLLAVVSAVGGGGAARGEAAQLPNLTPAQPLGVYIDAADDPSLYPFALRFTTQIVNRGAYPFELLAQPDDWQNLDEQPADALECVSWNGRICQQRQSAGTFTWSTGHGHFHIDALARYELRRLDPISGKPDWSAAGLVASAVKTTFCLEDSWFDVTWKPGPNTTPLYKYCDALLQGISPGWYDEYGGELDGQQFSLNGIQDGRYAIVVVVNPDNNFYETTSHDNIAWTRIMLTDHAGTVAEF